MLMNTLKYQAQGPRFMPSGALDRLSLFLRGITYTSALLVGATFLWLTAYIVLKGTPCLSWQIFSFEYSSENVSMLPALCVTLIMVAMALIFAAPIGIGAAIYLVEYAVNESRLVGLIRLTCESLAGIPSIVYGLFGFLLFVVYLGMGFSLLAGSLTLAVMILPLIMRTSEEALKSVPPGLREGSFALGAGRLATIFRVLLPSAMPGILAGLILAIGRVVGESAALLYTAGTVAAMPEGVFSSGRTLAVHMYALLSEGLYIREAHATALVLLLMTLLINAASSFAARLLTAEKE